MLFHLVKKDCLIIKKYLFLMMLIALGMPLFILWRMPEFLGFTAFLLTVIFVELMLTQSVSLMETKYPKASALLCAAPYPRSALVKAKYLFTVLIFAYCYTAYSIESWLLPRIKHLSPFSVITVLLIVTIIFSIFEPMQYRFGYEKTKYFYMIVIMAAPFLLPTVVKTISSANLDFRGFNLLPPFAQYLIPVICIVIIGFISLVVSIKIYSKKEL